MSLEDRHWPSLCIIAVVVRSVVVVVVCAEATPVINAVLSNAAAKLSLWLTASLLIGAFAASLAATDGGYVRDRNASLTEQ